MICTKTLSKSEIFTTSDLNQFKRIGGNRRINRDHLLALKRSIMRKNLLGYEPILVDSNMGVIDGQHRLEAAKELKTEIHYMIVPDAKFEDITLLNSNLLNWSLEDYLIAWSERGNETYSDVIKFAKQYNLNTSNAIAILNTNGSLNSLTAPLRVFKAGDFKIRDIQLAHDFAKFWRKMQVYAPLAAVKSDREFMRALYRIFISEEVDLEKLFSVYEAYGTPIEPRTTFVDYLRQMEDVYNRGVRISRTRFY